MRQTLLLYFTQSIYWTVLSEIVSLLIIPFESYFIITYYTKIIKKHNIKTLRKKKNCQRASNLFSIKLREIYVQPAGFTFQILKASRDRIDKKGALYFL